MTDNIVSTISRFLTPELISKMASATGLDRTMAHKATAAAVPAILTGLADMAGPGAEHTGHLLAWAIQKNLTASQILQMPFYYPTLEEGLKPALREICKQAGHEQDEPLAVGAINHGDDQAAEFLETLDAVMMLRPSGLKAAYKTAAL